MLNKKTFKVNIECVMEFQIGKEDTDDNFSEDANFRLIAEEIASDVLQHNARGIIVTNVEEMQVEQITPERFRDELEKTIFENIDLGINNFEHIEDNKFKISFIEDGSEFVVEISKTNDA